MMEAGKPWRCACGRLATCMRFLIVANGPSMAAASHSSSTAFLFFVCEPLRRRRFMVENMKAPFRDLFVFPPFTVCWT